MTVLQWLRVQWDRVVAGAAVVVGLVALVAGWHGAANELAPAGQIPFVVSGGVGGLFALGIGATLWISAELRDQWFKLDRLEQQLRADSRPDTDPPTSGTEPAGGFEIPAAVEANGTATRPRRPARAGSAG